MVLRGRCGGAKGLTPLPLPPLSQATHPPGGDLGAVVSVVRVSTLSTQGDLCLDPPTGIFLHPQENKNCTHTDHFYIMTCSPRSQMRSNWSTFSGKDINEGSMLVAAHM